jgi:hypothetical protein
MLRCCDFLRGWIADFPAICRNLPASPTLAGRDGLASDCQHSHAFPDQLGTCSGRAVRPHLSQNLARFWRLRFWCEWQRRFCVVFACALTRESLGRHLGVNIFSGGWDAAHGRRAKRGATLP